MSFSTFLKLDGLVDTSTAGGHVGEIEVFSFSWGASNPAPSPGGAGAGAGKVSISSFNIMKRADQVSPALFLACAKGSHYKTATVTLVKAAGPSAPGGPTPFIEYDFTDVVVESIQWSGSSGGDDAPTESVSLAFAKAVYKSATQSPTGAAAASQTGWDLGANKQV
jgi:type VI secretion system secreted protein Hcp